jgi:hypothetical protein
MEILDARTATEHGILAVLEIMIRVIELASSRQIAGDVALVATGDLVAVVLAEIPG